MEESEANRLRELRLENAKLRVKVDELEEALGDLTFPPFLLGGNFSPDIAIERLLHAEVLSVVSDMTVRVRCNDLFYWATSDSEPLTRSDVEAVWIAHGQHEDWGHLRWCCLRRGQRPQPAVEKLWKKEGFWDDELEALTRKGSKDG